MLQFLTKIKNNQRTPDKEFQLFVQSCRAILHKRGVNDVSRQDDIIQEAWAKHLTKMHKAKDLGAYFRTILINVSNDYHTRSLPKERNTQSLDALADRVVCPSIEDQMTYQICMQRLNMDKQMARAFSLKQAKYKDNEIAKMMDLDYRTVQKLCKRAQELFKKLTNNEKK
jgi:DNA-directed RNA polymerase specialized sigma24 family protein